MEELGCPLADCRSKEAVVESMLPIDRYQITCGRSDQFQVVASRWGEFRRESDLMEGLRAYIKFKNAEEPPVIPELDIHWRAFANKHKVSNWTKDLYK